VKSLQDSLSNGDQLMLYGLYKQATEGDADVTKKPSALNMVGTLKFQAWMQFQSMPRTAAMMHYIQAVGELGNTDNSSEEGDAEPSSAMGLKPSIMLHEQVHALDDSATWEEKLRRAASQGSYETMMHLLNNNNNNSEIDINAPDDSGQTALHFCADRGHLSGVELLLENGAVVDSIDHDGISVLQAAVIAGHVDICSVLLQNGADPDHLDSDGDSPKSCAEGDDDIMELFRRLNPSMEE
jgi:ankyrin repeat protein